MKVLNEFLTDLVYCDATEDNATYHCFTTTESSSLMLSTTTPVTSKTTNVNTFIHADAYRFLYS